MESAVVKRTAPEVVTALVEADLAPEAVATPAEAVLVPEAVATPAETVLVPEAGATLMEAALAQGTAPEVEIDPEDAITTIRTIPDITTALDRSQGRSHSGTL